MCLWMKDRTRHTHGLKCAKILMVRHTEKTWQSNTDPARSGAHAGSKYWKEDIEKQVFHWGQWCTQWTNNWGRDRQVIFEIKRNHFCLINSTIWLSFKARIPVQYPFFISLALLSIHRVSILVTAPSFTSHAMDGQEGRQTCECIHGQKAILNKMLE